MIDIALKKRGKGEETTSYDVKEDMTQRTLLLLLQRCKRE